MNLTEFGFNKSDITEHPKVIVKDIVIDIILTSNYTHFKNGSLKRLINNFWNIYKCRESQKEIETLYNHKLNEFETNKMI